MFKILIVAAALVLGACSLTEDECFVWEGRTFEGDTFYARGIVDDGLPIEMWDCYLAPEADLFSFCRIDVENECVTPEDYQCALQPLDCWRNP